MYSPLLAKGSSNFAKSLITVINIKIFVLFSFLVVLLIILYLLLIYFNDKYKELFYTKILIIMYLFIKFFAFLYLLNIYNYIHNLIMLGLFPIIIIAIGGYLDGNVLGKKKFLSLLIFNLIFISLLFFFRPYIDIELNYIFNVMTNPSNVHNDAYWMSTNAGLMLHSLSDNCLGFVTPYLIKYYNLPIHLSNINIRAVNSRIVAEIKMLHDFNNNYRSISAQTGRYVDYTTLSYEERVYVDRFTPHITEWHPNMVIEGLYIGDTSRIVDAREYHPNYGTSPIHDIIYARKFAFTLERLHSNATEYNIFKGVPHEQAKVYKTTLSEPSIKWYKGFLMANECKGIELQVPRDADQARQRRFIELCRFNKFHLIYKNEIYIQPEFIASLKTWFPPKN